MLAFHHSGVADAGGTQKPPFDDEKVTFSGPQSWKRRRRINRTSINGQKTPQPWVLFESNFRFRCYGPRRSTSDCFPAAADCWEGKAGGSPAAPAVVPSPEGADLSGGGLAGRAGTGAAVARRLPVVPGDLGVALTGTLRVPSTRRLAGPSLRRRSGRARLALGPVDPRFCPRRDRRSGRHREVFRLRDLSAVNWAARRRNATKLPTTRGGGSPWPFRSGKIAARRRRGTCSSWPRG